MGPKPTVAVPVTVQIKWNTKIDTIDKTTFRQQNKWGQFLNTKHNGDNTILQQQLYDSVLATNKKPLIQLQN